METQTLLARAHRDADKQRARLRADVQARLTLGVDAGRAESLRDAVAIGSAGFVRRVRELAAGRRLEGVCGKRALRSRLAWRDVRAAVERVKGQPWNVFAERRGDAGRDLFLWAARRYCGMTVGERGAVAGCARAATSVAIKRVEARAARVEGLRRL